MPAYASTSALPSPLPPGRLPDYPRDPQYTLAFVNDDGISITHPQVMVRISSKGVPIPGTSLCSRFTAVTCPFCNLPVYRVYQTTALDVQGKKWVLLPTEEWVEREVLKTATGWIDVHKDCLVGDGIASAQVSSSYAPVFNLYLPSHSSVPASPKVIKTDDEEISPKGTASSEVQTPSYLKESQQLCAAAEQRISDFIKAETAGVEKGIKRQVEVLWKEFRQYLASVQRECSVNSVCSPTRGTEAAQSGSLSMAVSSHVAVRKFEPVPVSLGDVVSVSPSVPRRSALSEYLATSGFHHPKERQKQNSPTGEASDDYSSDSRQTLLTGSGSSTLVHPVHQADRTNILRFKRNINDTINTEASYRYFLNMEENITRHKSQQDEKRRVARAQQDQEAEPPQVPSGPSANGKKPSREVHIVDPHPPVAEREARKDTSSRGPDKGKRKVTFDVQPAVIIINGENEEAEDDEEEEGPTEDARASNRPSQAKKARTQTDIAMDTFSILRPSPITKFFRNTDDKTMAARVSDSRRLLGIRPSSLTNPSYIQPIRSQPGVDSSLQGIILSLPRASVAHNNVALAPSSSQIPLNELDNELLKLTAADVPSHRGTWTPDSKAWLTLTRQEEAVDDGEQAKASSTISPLHEACRGKGKKTLDFSEEEDDFYEQSRNYGVAASLPIQIVKRVKLLEQLSLASYRLQAAVGLEQEGQIDSAVPASSSIHSNKHLSASTIRKAAYAERDRLRSMDPGVLDFSNDPDEQDDDSEEETGEQKAHKQALQTLQARSKMGCGEVWCHEH
ncbi:hypothetical protein NLJ89_g1279 [Agrocybe chaxingu]|uniref:Uncharacterized protein n=1 Tax=Agrocybe chaxingu TaxID=84603 RepID=A0A9W8N0E1_9AGAR|nr:hypothetical protein NLJ89_g1279 [Agrocybe chaxingu]